MSKYTLYDDKDIICSPEWQNDNNDGKYLWLLRKSWIHLPDGGCDGDGDGVPPVHHTKYVITKGEHVPQKWLRNSYFCIGDKFGVRTDVLLFHKHIYEVSQHRKALIRFETEIQRRHFHSNSMKLRSSLFMYIIPRIEEELWVDWSTLSLNCTDSFSLTHNMLAWISSFNFKSHLKLTWICIFISTEAAIKNQSNQNMQNNDNIVTLIQQYNVTRNCWKKRKKNMLKSLVL